MEHGHEPALANIGNFEFEVFGGGRKARYRSSHFKLRCDAIGIHKKEILLLSLVGPETSVKALTAGLRASGKDQKRIEYSARVGNLSDRGLAKCPDGYRIYRSKLDYGLWHVLCLAKRDGFMAIMTEESVWQLLQGERFTTPLLREWIPWLYRRMKDREIIVELTQNGCQAGLLLADSEALDTLIGEGLRQGKLAIGVQKARSPRRTMPALDAAIQSLDEYMLAHGQLLGKCQLNPALYEQEKSRVAARFEEAVQLAEQAFLAEFAKLIEHITERLSATGDGDRKIFRDTAITNLTEFFDRFRQLNVRSNEDLDALVERAQQVIRGVEPKNLRTNDSLRQHVSAQLAGVQSVLDGLMVDQPRRRIIRAQPSTNGDATRHPRD